MPEDKEKLARIKKTVSNAAVYINAEKNLKKLKAGKLGRIARLKKKAKTWAKEVVGGEKTYISKERHKEMVAVRKKKSKPKSIRTQAVESGLTKSGLTKEEIARFGGK